MSIIVRKFVIDDPVLDLIGKQFKFDHSKGISEWFKNSTDAYIRKNIPNNEQVIILRLHYGNPRRLERMEVIDFVGMTKEEIDNAFIRFFDPDAARYGAKEINIRTLGGHGNGGKFYMRQMFKSSRIITYRNGKLNIFGFNEKKQYGYEDGFENIDMDLQKSLKLANLKELQAPAKIWKQLASNKTGFTVVRGNQPIKASSTEQLKKLIDRLIKNAQARRLIERKPIFLVLNEDTKLLPLEVKKINAKKGFEEPVVFPIPKKIKVGIEVVEFSNSDPDYIGNLKLFTSEDPLIGSMADLNTIDFVGELGVIASYKLHQIGRFAFSNQLEFIYGECVVSILEKEEYDSISNDRQKFIENKHSQAILSWVRERIDELAERLDAAARKQRIAKKLSNTSIFNEILNRWKNRFMEKLLAEVRAGEGPLGICGLT